MSYIIGITPSQVWTSTEIPPFRPGQRGISVEVQTCDGVMPMM